MQHWCGAELPQRQSCRRESVRGGGQLSTCPDCRACCERFRSALTARWWHGQSTAGHGQHHTLSLAHVHTQDVSHMHTRQHTPSPPPSFHSPPPHTQAHAQKHAPTYTRTRTHLRDGAQEAERGVLERAQPLDLTHGRHVAPLRLLLLPLHRLLPQPVQDGHYLGGWVGGRGERGEGSDQREEGASGAMQRGRGFATDGEKLSCGFAGHRRVKEALRQ